MSEFLLLWKRRIWLRSKRTNVRINEELKVSYHTTLKAVVLVTLVKALVSQLGAVSQAPKPRAEAPIPFIEPTAYEPTFNNSGVMPATGIVVVPQLKDAFPFVVAGTSPALLLKVPGLGK